MSPIFRKTPFLRITGLFITGLLLSNQFPEWSGVAWWILFFTSLTIILANMRAGGSGGQLSSVAVLCLIVSLGGLWQSHNNQSTAVANFSDFSGNRSSLLVQIKDIKNRRCIAKVHRINDRTDVMGRILIYVDSTQKLEREFLHDYFYLKDVFIVGIRGPLNPHAFDAKRYYLSKGVSHQCFVGAGHMWRVAEHHHFLFSLLEKSQVYIRSQLEKVFITEHEFGLAQSLLLGDRRSLGEALKNAYSDTGSFHVLAVSGLHVGVIFLILRF